MPSRPSTSPDDSEFENSESTAGSSASAASLSRRTFASGLGAMLGPVFLSRATLPSAPVVSPVYTDVREFGAVGDGVHDDTKAIQEALNRAGGKVPARSGASVPTGDVSGGVTESGLSVPASAGGCVVLPRGHYKISESLYVPANCTLLGIGRGSVLRNVGSTAALRVARPATSDGYAFGVVLRDFMIWGDASVGPDQHGMHLQYASFGTIDNVNIEECGGHGVWINEHTVGMHLLNVRCRDNGQAQLFFDGLRDGSYENCDSHVVLGGLFQCRARGEHCIRVRRGADLNLYSPFCIGHSHSEGIRLEGAKDLFLGHSYIEYQGVHLCVTRDTVTGTPSSGCIISGGSWEGGRARSLNVRLEGDICTIIEDVQIHAPPAGSAGFSVLTITEESVAPTLRGDMTTLALHDQGVETLILDTAGQPVTSSVDREQSPNLISDPTNLTGGRWRLGSGVEAHSDVPGPTPGVSATRLSGVSSTFGSIEQLCESQSSGRMHALTFWARAAQGAAFLHAKISVPGDHDEVDEAIGVGPSWRRYVVQGPIGRPNRHQSDNRVAAVFTIPIGATVDITDVAMRAGSAGRSFGARTATRAELRPVRASRNVPVILDAVSASRVAIDASAGDYFTIMLYGDVTIARPEDSTAGRVITFELRNATMASVTTRFADGFRLLSPWSDPSPGARRVISFLDVSGTFLEQYRSPFDI